jgi:glutamate-ammonia-ligase adenylyltransferase
VPDWLTSFPFIERHWPQIQELSGQYPNPTDYDVAADWQQFTRTHATWDVFRTLRVFRASRLAWLAYTDIGRPVEQHPEVMQTVSVLADWLIHQAHNDSQHWMQERHGRVINAQGQTVQLMVFALGKLGTCELNYSSDIDLVFVYPDEGMSDGPRSLDAAHYFMRQGQRLIKLLDHVTTDGRVYQVDMRLRPFGSAAPLACSAASLHQYLVNEGRTWERFAWMRGRPVCGEPADQQQVLDALNGFIYRRHLDYSVFDSLARIKSDISRELDVDPGDLKLGTGGIRHIEFIVQSLQLVFGGRNPSLQGVSIQPLFERLAAAGKLSAADSQRLSMAWLWLRKTENACQMMADQGTHQLPADPTRGQHLAQAMGLDSLPQLHELLHHHRGNVSELMAGMFQQPGEHNRLSTDGQQQLATLLVQFNWDNMASDTAAKVRELLEKTVCMTTLETGQRFVDLVRAIIRRPGYLLMLLKEEGIHAQVLKLLSARTYFSEVLVRYPALLEQLFEQQAAIGLSADEWAEIWTDKDHLDEEQWMEHCRYFKLQQQFNLMRAHNDGLINETELRSGLTGLAECLLSVVLLRSWQETQDKMPCAGIRVSDLMVIAYGSMAMRQMHVHSDLDLVFVLDLDEPAAVERQFMQRWIRRLSHHLISPMYHGVLYEMDLQLRPNGQSGSLVTTRHEFARYQRQDAWIWEHAAMVKSRLVIGDQDQKDWHRSLRADILCRQRDPDEVDRELQNMAAKLEQWHGNKPHQEEFSLLAGVLKHAHQYPRLVELSHLQQIKDELQALQLE